MIRKNPFILIFSYFFAGPKKGRQEMFVDNLPGFPDNIRLSANGKSLYLALFGHRSQHSPDLLDRLGPWPIARKLLGEVKDKRN